MVTINPARPLKILLALDNSPHLVTAVDMLTHISWPAGTSVHLLAVVPERLPLMESSSETERKPDETTEIMRWRGWAATKIVTVQTADRLRDHHLTVENTEICEGQLEEIILKRTIALSPDLIVIGAKRFSRPGKIWLNPAAHKLAQYARRSVLVVRPAEPVRPLNTILAVDGSSAAWRAVEFVGALSLPDWAKITVVSVTQQQAGGATRQDSPDCDQQPSWLQGIGQAQMAATEAVATEVVSYLHDCGVAVRWLCRHRGNPTNEILSVAHEQQAALVVIGTKRQTGAEAFRHPSVTQEILKYAPCSVLVVP